MKQATDKMNGRRPSSPVEDEDDFDIPPIYLDVIASLAQQKFDELVMEKLASDALSLPDKPGILRTEGFWNAVTVVFVSLLAGVLLAYYISLP